MPRVDMLPLALGAPMVSCWGSITLPSRSGALARTRSHRPRRRYQVEKAEIAQWFSDKMASGGGSISSSSSSSGGGGGGAKYEKLVAVYSDGDDVFNDEELKEFDAMDEPAGER